MLRFVRHIVVMGTVLALVGCGGSGGGGSLGSCVPGNSAAITVSGKITFDRVPHLSDSGGLDYTNTSQDPVRGAVVEAVCNATVIATVTDALGDYSLNISGGTSNIVVRVKAQMQKTGTPSWNFQVRDNTSGGALYSLSSAPLPELTVNSILDLHAASGWGGVSYTTTRSAGPFAILDSVYDAFNKVLVVNPSAVFPALNLNWSINNVPTSGRTALGQIQTSHYNGTEIFILGKSNVDTDEYDGHVVIHEWAHYFEDKFSRSDSIGGPHGGDDVLDIRVAFGEGFGNAYSAIATDDPIYADSSSSQQASGFRLNMEDNCTGGVATRRGWYSECSVMSILYDLYDVTNDGSDTLVIGFTPLYNVLVNEQKNTAAMTSIFSFIDALKQNISINPADIDALLLAQSITSVADEYGSTQSINNTGLADATPVYSTAIIGGAAVTVCSTNQFQAYNGYGGSRFIKFNVPSDRILSIVATHVSGTGNRPYLELWKNGVLVEYAYATGGGTKTLNTPMLLAGDYVLEVYDFGNNNDPGVGSTCYDVTM